MQSSIQRIGVIGLGHMGSDFASNLMADGFQIKVYDRNEKHTAPIVARGATAAAGLGDLADCEAVLTSLPDDDALADVTLRDEGLVHVLGRGAIHVSMSTVSPGLSRRLAHQHELAGQGYVAAPVLGNPDLAEARKLFVIVAGALSAVGRVSPVLERLGQRLFLLGDDPGAANLMMVAANALTALTLQSVGEVFALLRKGGVDAGAAFEVLTGSFFDGKVHKTYGGKIVGSHLAVKDLRRALTEAEHMAVPMPQQAWFMIVSSQLLLAVGLSSTGQPWVCSPPAMRGCLRILVCLPVNESHSLGDFRFQCVTALSLRGD
jgi:3-hydroxyisobutyrate dehydrogenase-like beta-hydroxyacid dehydrogenase